MSVGRFGIAAGHFLVDDRVPIALALVLGHVVFAGPAAELEFADEIDIGKYGGCHGWLGRERVDGYGEKRKNPSVMLLTLGL